MAKVQSAVPTNSSLFLCQYCQKLISLEPSLHGQIDVARLGITAHTGDTHSNEVSVVLILEIYVHVLSGHVQSGHIHSGHIQTGPGFYPGEHHMPRGV